MGHVINPISTRLGINTFWNSNWALNNKYNYNKMNKYNIFLFKFLNWIMSSKKFKHRNIMFTHYRVFINNKNNIYINLFFYLPFLESFHKGRIILIRMLPFFKKKFLKNKKKMKFFQQKRMAWKIRKKRNFLKWKYKKLNNYFFNFFILNLYWYILTKYWSFFINEEKKLYFFLRHINFKDITPTLIGKYIGMRLIQKYSLKYTVRPILRDLHFRIKQKKIQGYRIQCTGRFTRRQIAENNWYKEGPVTSNNFTSLIKYYQTKVRLKYSVCGIKVWLSYGERDNSSVLNTNRLVFPYHRFKYYKLLSDKFNYGFLVNNNVWFYLNFKFKFSKLSNSIYQFLIEKKIYFHFYENYIIKLFNEFIMLKKKKKIKRYFKYFRKIFVVQLVNLNINSKNSFLNMQSNNNNKIFFKKTFIYE